MIEFYIDSDALINFSNFKKALFWVCFLALNALALSPAPYLPPGLFDWWDKAQHAIGFGTLTVLAVLAYPDVSKLRIGLMLVALGVLIEVLQYFSGYRFGDWQDAVADGVGVLGGLVGLTGLMRIEWLSQLVGRKTLGNADES
jgi:VanZ family protein